MRAFSRWRWRVLALVLALASSAARAEMITPNSIPNPPSAVGAVPGTPVPYNDLVTRQYAGLGLSLNDVAITKLDGLSIWSSVTFNTTFGAALSYGPGVQGTFVLPNSSNPTTISSLAITTFGPVDPSGLKVYGLNGQPLNIVPVLQNNTEPFSVQIWTLSGPGISSFSVSPPHIPADAWGVSAISFTPSTATAPEPSSLVLAALGALGMASRLGWRRLRAVVA